MKHNKEILSMQLDIKVDDEFKFHPKRRWRFDFHIPSLKIAIEIEGGIWMKSGRHTSGSGYTKDMEKYNNAALMGYIVLRFTPSQIMKQEYLNLIREAIKLRKEGKI
jgi:very-short-patch-repair endonuclease